MTVSNYSQGKSCSECGKPVVNRNRSGKCRSCFNKWRTGTNHHNWKGGTIQPTGYRVVYGHKGHPNARARGDILEHVLVMSRKVGRGLLPHETVHHRNGDRADNRIENLELWSSSQPPGQRVEDKLEWAREIIALYDKYQP